MGNKKSTPYLSRPDGDVVNNPLADGGEEGAAQAATTPSDARQGGFRASAKAEHASSSILGVAHSTTPKANGREGGGGGKRRVYIQRNEQGFGFQFSTNTKVYSQGLNHFILSVDAGGPAQDSGLRVGDRMLAVNDQSVVNLSHAQVIAVLKAASDQLRPLKMVVCEANSVISASLHASRQASPAPSIARHSVISLGLDSQSFTSSGSPTARAGGALMRQVMVVVRRSLDGKILAVRTTQGRGWWLPAGPLERGQAFEDAAHSITLRSTNVPICLSGILRMEQEPLGMRVVLLALPRDSTAPKTTPDKVSDEAAWKSLSELRELQQLGSPPWAGEEAGLRGLELLDWARYLEAGGMVAPLHFLGKASDPVWCPQFGPGDSPAAIREQQRTGSKVSSPDQGLAVVPATPTATATATATADVAEQLPPSPGTAALVVRALTGGLVKEGAVRRAKQGVQFAPAPVYLETWAKEEYDRPLDPPDGMSSLRELFSRNNDEVEQEQEQEMVDSVAASQMHGLWLSKADGEAFGIKVRALNRLDPDSPPFVLAEAVVISELVAGGAAARDGRLRLGDRIMKINNDIMLGQAHIEFFFHEVLPNSPAMDITVTRGEPLPPLPDFAALSDRQLEGLIFEHLGQRVSISDEGGWSRDQAVASLLPRFDMSSSAPSAAQAFQQRSDSSNGYVEVSAETEDDDTDADADAEDRDTAGDSKDSNGDNDGNNKNDDDNSKDDDSSSTGSTLAPLEAATAATDSALKRRVSWKEAEMKTEYETWAKEEYARVLEVGDDANDLRSLFYKNNLAMEEEQEVELKEAVRTHQMHGLWVSKKDCKTFGMELEAVPRLTAASPDFLYSEAVLVKALDPAGAVAKDGRIRVGDRIVKLNNDWLSCMSQAAFIMEEMVEDSPAVDITITRNEPLPSAPEDFAALSDKQLEGLVFEHLGMRVKLGSDRGEWNRDQALEVLRPRFAEFVAKPRSGKAVDFKHTLCTEYETWAKEEYARVLDPGEGKSHLSELFRQNNKEMEDEQEAELKRAVEAHRMEGLWLSKGDHGKFGIRVRAVPRFTPESPDFLYSEGVVIDGLDPDGAAAADGKLRVGDRIVKVNNDWILCHSHALFLLNDILESNPAGDLTITRNEPLPERPDIEGMADRQVEGLVFEHLGTRIRIDADAGWGRDQALEVLEPRFRPSAPKVKRSVAWSEEMTVDYETWAKEEYERVLDPGEGCKDLRQLFNKNSMEMEDETEAELKEAVRTHQMYGLWVSKKDCKTFGMELEALPRLSPEGPPFLFAEAVRVKALDPAGAVAKDGRIRVGDRIVKLNNDWLSCFQQAEFLMAEMIEDSPAVDLTVTRGEKLPRAPDFAALSDKQLAGLVFEHLGVRATISDDYGGLTRDKALDLVRPRFQEFAKRSDADDRADRNVHFPASDDDLRIEYETWAKEEYERVLDPGEGKSHLSELFRANNQAMEDEQEQEARDSVAEVRMEGLWLSKGDHARFGISVDCIPRCEDRHRFLFAESVVVSALDPDGAAAADGRIRVGDRIVKINNDFLLCRMQAEFFLSEVVESNPAVDITITRNEALPEAPDFDELKDSQLAGLVFEHLGMRISIGDDAWSRDQAVTVLLPRFGESEL